MFTFILFVAMLLPLPNLSFYTILSLALGFDFVCIGMSIRSVKKATNKLEKTKASLTFFREKELLDIEEFKRNLYYQTEQMINTNDMNINRLTMEVNTLWDILSSDDFCTALANKSKNIDELTGALSKEWESYLKEVNRTPISSNHLECPLIEKSFYEGVDKKYTKNNKQRKKLPIINYPYTKKNS